MAARCACTVRMRALATACCVHKTQCHSNSNSEHPAVWFAQNDRAHTRGAGGPDGLVRVVVTGPRRQGSRGCEGGPAELASAAPCTLKPSPWRERGDSRDDYSRTRATCLEP